MLREIEGPFSEPLRIVFVDALYPTKGSKEWIGSHLLKSDSVAKRIWTFEATSMTNVFTIGFHLLDLKTFFKIRIVVTKHLSNSMYFRMYRNPSNLTDPMLKEKEF